MQMQLKPMTKYLLIAILSILGLALIFTGFSNLQKEETITEKVTLMSYELKPEIQYRFMLQPNSIYDKKYLTREQGIPLNLVDYVEAHLFFTLHVHGAEAVNLRLVQEEKLETFFGSDDLLLWEKKGPRHEYIFTQSSDSSDYWGVDALTNLHINQFNDFQKQANDESGVSGNPHYNTYWRIIGNIEHEGGETLIDHTYDLKIPLNLNVWEAPEENFEKLKQAFNLSQEVTKAPDFYQSYGFMALGGLCVVFALIAYFFVSIQPTLSTYQKEKKRTFKLYEDRLVALNAIPHGGFFNLIAIKTIEDLVKIADEIRQPIYYHEMESGSEYKIEYYVFDKDKSYYMIEMDIAQKEAKHEN